MAGMVGKCDAGQPSEAVAPGLLRVGKGGCQFAVETAVHFVGTTSNVADPDDLSGLVNCGS